MEERIIELFRLLVELRENKKVPKKYKRELERLIGFVDEIIKDPRSLDKKKNALSRVIAFIIKFLTVP